MSYCNTNITWAVLEKFAILNRLMIHIPEILTLKNMYLSHWQRRQQRQTSEVKHLADAFVPPKWFVLDKQLHFRSGVYVIKI